MTTSRSMFSNTIKTVNQELHQNEGMDAHLSRTLFKGDSIRGRHEQAVVIRVVNAITKQAYYSNCDSKEMNNDLYNKQEALITAEMGKLKQELGKRNKGEVRKDLHLFISKLDEGMRKYNALLRDARYAHNEHMYLSYLAQQAEVNKLPQLKFTKEKLAEFAGYLKQYHKDAPLNMEELSFTVSANEKLVEQLKEKVEQRDSQAAQTNDKKLGMKKLEGIAR